jgi:hypothetical protein
MKTHMLVYSLVVALVLGAGFSIFTLIQSTEGLISGTISTYVMPLSYASVVTLVALDTPGGGTSLMSPLPSPDQRTIPGSDFQSSRGYDLRSDPTHQRDGNQTGQKPSAAFCASYKGLCPGS